MLSTCTFIQTMLKWPPVNRETSRKRDRQTDRQRQRDRDRQTDRQIDRDKQTDRQRQRQRETDRNREIEFLFYLFVCLVGFCLFVVVSFVYKNFCCAGAF